MLIFFLACAICCKAMFNNFSLLPRSIHQQIATLAALVIDVDPV